MEPENDRDPSEDQDQTAPAAPAEREDAQAEPSAEQPAEPAESEQPDADAGAEAEEAEPEEKPKDEKPFRLTSGPTYEEQRAKLVEHVEACEASVSKHRNAMKKASRTVAELAAHNLDTQNAVAEYRKEDAAWQNAVDALNCALDELRSCDANPEQFDRPASDEAAAPSSPDEPADWDGTSVELLDVPEEAYHEAARKREFTSSHYLALFRRCPRLYHEEMIGLAPRKDTVAFSIGRAAHVAILEGTDEFESRFVVADPPVNERTGAPYGSDTKKFAEWAAQFDRPVVSTADFGVIKNMRLSVLEHPEAGKLFDDGGYPEGTVRVAEFCGLPCQIRIDWFHPRFGIVDLKTCSDIERFVFDARDYGYIHQLAFYRSVLGAAFPQAAGAPVTIVAVEKQPPYRCGVWRIAPLSLARAAGENADGLARLASALESGSWPTGYETPRTLALPKD